MHFPETDESMEVHFSKAERSDYGLARVAEEVLRALASLNLDPETVHALCEKLTHYRVVREIGDFRPGSYVRWIRRDAPPGSAPVLATGGHVLDLKFSDNGTNVMVRRAGNIVMKYAFDKCISFQRMDEDEMLVRMACDGGL